MTFGNYGASTYYYSKTGSQKNITIPSSGPRIAIINIPVGEYYLVEISTVDGKMVYGEKNPVVIELAKPTDTGGAGTGVYRWEKKKFTSILHEFAYGFYSLNLQ